MTWTTLITGASTGIGYELSKIVARNKHNVVLVSRNKEKLEQLAEELRAEHSVEVTVIPSDLAVAGASHAVVRELEKRGVTIDILVNNAGFGMFGKFAGSELKEIDELLQLNVVALTDLSRLLAPAMVQRKRGKIVNIASTAAFVPGPWMAVYYASKAYVLSLSEALATEMDGTGVTVTVVCPGPTATEFQGRAKMAQSKLFTMVSPMTAYAVAEDTYKGMMAGKTIVIPGTSNQILAGTSRFIPRSVTAKLVARLNSSR